MTLSSPTVAAMTAPGRANGRLRPLLSNALPYGNASHFTLTCLSATVDIRVNGQPLRPLRSKKGTWLLSLLAAHHGRDLTRQWLADRLWPELDDDAARKAVRQCLWDLRKVLEDDPSRLVVSQAGVRLNTQNAEIDIADFDNAMRRGDPISLAFAVSIYKGPFLDGCDEPWALHERELRRVAVLQALDTLATAEERNHELAAASEYRRQAVIIAPLDEPTLRAAMRCHAVNGDHAEAIQAFRAFENLLRKLDPVRRPADETLETYRTSRLGRTEPNAAQASELPPRPLIPVPLTEMIGRDAVVDSIVNLTSKRRLVTLTGVGGVGKTRLALAVAAETEGRYPQGVAFVNLAAISDRSLVSATVSNALALPDYPEQTTLETVVTILRRTELLLVIDNCEHVIEAVAEFVEQLLATCPKVRILATSREPLRVAGERSVPIAPLEIPDETSTDAKEIAGSSSVRLLIERLDDAGATLLEDEQSIQALARICRRLDGIPLAIELAAVAGASISPCVLASSLDNRFSKLVGGRRSSIPRHQTLHAVIEWSYDLLDDHERGLFRQLSVFEGGWTLDAVEHICAGDRPGWAVVDLLTSLVRKSLVIYDPITTQYTMLETIREFAVERMEDGSHLTELRNRHREYFGRLIGVDSKRDRLAIASNIGNLRAAVRWCLYQPGQAEIALELCSAYLSVVHVPGVIRDAQERMREVLEKPEMLGSHISRVKALWVAGYLQLKSGNTSIARIMYREALSIGEEIGNTDHRANILRHMAEGDQMDGNLDRAACYLREALTLLQVEKNSHVTGWVLIQLSQIAEQRGELDVAEHYTKDAVAVWDRTPDSGMEIVSHRLASIALKRGHRELARDYVAASRCNRAYPWCDELEVTASIALAYGRADIAAIIHGAMFSLLEQIGQVSAWKRRLRPQQDDARTMLGAEDYAAAFNRGRRVPTADAVDQALAAMV